MRILELIGEGDYGRAFPGRGSPESAGWNRDPFKVLIATVLSQRTRDRNTADAADRLFSRYGDPASIASAPMEEVMELIRPAGFPRAKAKAIREIARIVDTRHGGEAPADMESLLALPMVGRKTANCVLAYAFGKDAICVDTHVHRIANRIGLVRAKDPEGTEKELRRTFPREYWREINALLVVFGQQVCRPRGPRCGDCPVNRYCDYYRNSDRG